MFRAVVAKVMMKYLNTYLMKIKWNQMDMQMWKGSVSLDDLEIRSTALMHHGVPLTVKKGVIEHVNVSFPWKKLNTQACVLELRGVHMVLELDSEGIVDREVMAELATVQSRGKGATKEDERGAWQGLMSTIIDNVRVKVSDIHVRIHFATERGTVSLGLIIHEFSLFTVDERGNALNHVVKRADVVRKCVQLRGLIVYFDTIVTDSLDMNNNALFAKQMHNLMGQENHQNILKPFNVSSRLVHTRNTTEKLKNVLEIEAETLNMGVDYSQYQGLTTVNEIWEMWRRRAKYALCGRPSDIGNANGLVLWGYLHRCSVQIRRPREFKPLLALDILKNRAQYLRHVVKGKKAGHRPPYDDVIRKIEKSVGPAASIFLRAYAEAKVISEASQNEQLTAMDITELKGIIQTTDMFFDASSFSAALNIPLIVFEISAAQGCPLARIHLFDIRTDLRSDKTGAGLRFNILSCILESYQNDGKVRQLLMVEQGDGDLFMKVNIVVPVTADSMAMDVHLQSMILQMDLDVMRRILELFGPQARGEVVVSEDSGKEAQHKRIIMVDFADELEPLLFFKNYVLNFKCSSVVLVLPFTVSEKEEQLRFAIKAIDIQKHPGQIVTRATDDVRMSFVVKFDIDDLLISDIVLFKQFPFSFICGLTFLPSEQRVVFEGVMKIGALYFESGERAITLLLAAWACIASIGLPIYESSSSRVQAQAVQTWRSFVRVPCSFGMNIDSVGITLPDAQLYLGLSTISGSYKIVKGLTMADISVERLMLKEDDKETVDFPNSVTHFILMQEGIRSPVTYKVCLAEPHLYLDFGWAKRLKEKVIKIVSVFGSSDTQAASPDENAATKITFVLEKPIIEIPDECAKLLMKCDSIVYGSQIELVNVTLFKDDEMRIQPFSMSLKNRKDSITGTIDNLDVLIDAKLIFAVLRVIWHVTQFTANDTPNPDTLAVEFVVRQVGVALRTAGDIFGTAVVKDIVYKATSQAGNGTGTIKIGEVHAIQTIGDATLPLFTLREGLKIETSASPTFQDLKLCIAGIEIFLSQKACAFIMELSADDSLSVREVPDAHSAYSIRHVKAFLLDGCESPAFLEIDNVDVGIDLRDKGSHRTTTVNVMGVAGKVYLAESNVCDVLSIPGPINVNLDRGHAKLEIETVFLSGSFPALTVFGRTLAALNSGSAENVGPVMLKLGLDFKVGEIIFSSTPKEFDNDRYSLSINDFRAILKRSHKLGSLSVGGVRCHVQFTNPADALFIDGISVFASFDAAKGDLDFVDISELNDDDAEPVTVKELAFKACVKTVNVKYTHDFARSIVRSLGGSDLAPSRISREDADIIEACEWDGVRQMEAIMFNNVKPVVEESVNAVSADVTPAADALESALDVRGAASLGELDLVMYCVNPIGRISLSEVAASYTLGEWNGHARDLNVFAMDGNETARSLLLCDGDTPLLGLKIVGKMCETDFAPFVFRMDYAFYLMMMNYILRSPFLHMGMGNSPDTAETAQFTLPFDWKVNAKNITIHVPTSATDPNAPLFVVNTSFGMQLTMQLFEISVCDMRVFFRDTATGTDFLPLFENVSLNLARSISEDQRISVKMEVATNVIMTLSAADLILFNNIRTGIQQAAGLMLFSEDTSSPKDKPSSMSEFVFRWSGSRLMICRDNRSSSRYVPMFQIGIPATFGTLKSVNGIGSMDMTVIPCVMYFNEMTAKWDLILEQVHLRFGATLDGENTSVSLCVAHHINVNLPTRAIIQYLNLAEEIQKSLTQTTTVTAQLPKFWIENNTMEDVLFKVSDRTSFTLKTGDDIPVFNLEETTLMTIVYADQVFTIKPMDIIYPVFMSRDVSVSRKPYKGGILLLFQTPVQLCNRLRTDIDVYQQSGNERYRLVRILKYREPCPLVIKNATENFIFVKHGSEVGKKQQIVSLGRQMRDPILVNMDIDGVPGKIQIVFQVDTHSALLKINVTAPVIGLSLLPIPLHMNLSRRKEGYLAEPLKKFDILEIPPSIWKFSAGFSLDSSTDVPYEKVSISVKKPCRAPLYNSMTKRTENLAVFCEQEEESKQITILLFVPCVFFNVMANGTLRIVEPASSKSRHPLSVDVGPNASSFWCPDAFFDSEDTTHVHVTIPGFSETGEKFDCVSARTGFLFIESDKQKGVFIGMRYDVSIKRLISVVTFSRLLSVHSELDVGFVLQPVADVPGQSTEDRQDIGFSARVTDIGPPVLVEPGSGECIVEQMTRSGAFMITISGCSSTPVLNLLKEQRNVFRVQSGCETRHIECEVIDCGTQFHVYVRKATFPTPVVIANCLGTSVSAYQIIAANPIVVEPHSTSIFAYDEPCGYHEMYVSFDDQKLHLAFADETGYVPTNTKHDGKLVLVSVQKTKYGSMAIIITTEVPAIKDTLISKFSITLEEVQVSLIDLQMREIILVSLIDIQANVLAKTSGIVFSAEMKTLQVDDQNPRTPNPVVILGRSRDGRPFVSVKCIMPSDVPMFSAIDYSSIEVQRLDLEVDAAFVSDLYYVVAEVVKPLKESVTPRPASMPSEASSNVASFNWLEMTPMFAILKYNRKTKRPAIVHKMQKYLKYVPSLTGKLRLPGVIATQLSDEFPLIREKITSEYKTAAFHQIIEMLGGKGRLMSAFGVTASLAKMLNIKLTSELSSDVEAFKMGHSEEFDNRRALTGPFARETLASVNDMIQQHELCQSAYVNALADGTDIGVMMKAAGKGVIGLTSKMDQGLQQTNVELMQGASRRRIPRAFPRNEIDGYIALPSIAQMAIQRTNANEQIRLEVFPRENQYEYVLLTDRFLFTMGRDRTGPIKKVRICKIIAIDTELDSVDMVITTKDKTTTTIMIHCSDTSEKQQIQTYLNSQMLMHSLFGDSLI